jgi:hypothetical protein
MDRPSDVTVTLRHALATLAYRAAKVLRDAPRFGDVRAAPSTRTAVQIVAHMADLLEWATRTADGVIQWHESPPGAWDDEIDRLFAAIQALDERLATGAPLGCPPEKLFQGPIADALTHVGQLATLRRLAGSGVRGESYFRADIAVGRVGRDQSPPTFEFD